VLEDLLYKLADLVETELKCFVYLFCGHTCFVPYTYDDMIGEINIKSHLDDFKKLIALTHEIGYILDLSVTTNVVQEELNAWHLGYKFMLINDIMINKEEYFAEMYICLSKYIEKEN